VRTHQSMNSSMDSNQIMNAEEALDNFTRNDDRGGGVGGIY
jgi:hypothetical protein